MRLLRETWVVVATGTEVGKTHVSMCILEALRRGGTSALGLKPVESGGSSSVETDAARLGRASGARVPPRYAFAPPISPHLAARDVGTPIEVAEVVAWVDAHRGDEGVTLVETAGGLLSPLSETATNLDLMVALAPTEVVLVVGNRLGALHDARACMMALAAVGWQRSRVVVALSDAMPAKGRPMATNGAELRTLGVVSRLVRVAHGKVDGDAGRRGGEELVAMVRNRGGGSPG
ncbi:MAG: dethiobiotin synthase [Myxococcota bacterium]